MNRRNAIAIATLISLFVVAGFADDKPPSEKEINTLVKQLVSPNRAPKTEGADAEYPASYDRDAQERVRHAWSQLHRMEGHRVFPYLFEHFDDKRYSFTADGGSSDVNWSVGRACSDILICHLQPYGGIAHSGDHPGIRPRPSYSQHHNLRTAAGAKLWWETRKDKSLRDLQIEALEWVIAEEAKTPKTYPDLGS